jgi:hypothetical protein
LKALDVEWIHVPASLDEGSRKGEAQVLARRLGRPSTRHE